MTDDTRALAFLERWHRIVAERDLDGLREILADDVELGAPPYWAPLQGADLVHHLLGLIIQTIEGFTYHREWIAGSELALEFKGRVGDMDLQGVDLISVDADGQLAHLDVAIRPLNAVTELKNRIAPQMAAYLQSRAG